MVYTDWLWTRHYLGRLVRTLQLGVARYSLVGESVGLTRSTTCTVFLTILNNYDTRKLFKSLRALGKSTTSSQVQGSDRSRTKLQTR